MPLYAFEGQQPALAEGAWIAPSAELIGDVRLAEQTSVWFGAVIRADNTTIAVGARSNVQEGAMLHSDPDAPLTVGADCTIGHHAILHGCTIEDGVLIGMNATVLNLAVIGAGSLVAAGAVVLEGTVVPPGSLVAGVPAKVRRELTEEERAGIRDNAARYLGYREVHRAAN